VAKGQTPFFTIIKGKDQKFTQNTVGIALSTFNIL
jgi:hypothetical protein